MVQHTSISSAPFACHGSDCHFLATSTPLALPEVHPRAVPKAWVPCGPLGALFPQGHVAGEVACTQPPKPQACTHLMTQTSTHRHTPTSNLTHRPAPETYQKLHLGAPTPDGGIWMHQVALTLGPLAAAHHAQHVVTNSTATAATAQRQQQRGRLAELTLPRHTGPSTRSLSCYPCLLLQPGVWCSRCRRRSHNQNAHTPTHHATICRCTM